MPRGRSTPYSAQLRKFLRARELRVFTAATLEGRFDHPPRQKRGTNIGGIHKALMKAFAEGKVISFLDADGNPLRESEIIVPGSKAIGQPQFFGLPGAASPDPAYHPVTYEATLRRGIKLEGDAAEAVGGDEEQPRTDQPDDGYAAGGSSGANSESYGELPDISVEDATKRIASFPSRGATAPRWVEEAVLRAWASVPEVTRHMVHGLDSAKGSDKFELIRAGVTRKQRTWRSESTIAGNLAKLCLTSPSVWFNVASTAAKGYLASGAVPPDDLPALAADSLDYYEESDAPPEAVLLLALALDVDEAVLELIAVDCARELGEVKALDKTSAQEDRIHMLETEAIELRRAAKESDKALREAQKREKKLIAETEALRAAHAEAGEAADAAHAQADAMLRARAEEAEATLERLESERIPELEAQLEGLEGVREHLENTEIALREERQLRTQAQEDAKRHNQRARELTDRISSEAGTHSLPIDNAAALIDALGRPVGHAARQAAERLAAGRARSDDDLLLELASTVAQMTRRLDTDEDRQLVADAPTPPSAMPEATSVGQGELELYGTSVEAAPTASEPPSVAQDPAAEEVAEDQLSPAGAVAAPALLGRRRARSKLKVRALGGAGEVGGSAFLVTNASNHAVLLDCGQRVRGEYGLDTEPQFHRRIGHDGRLHGILISHAHIDHVGSLPVLHREQSEAQHEPIPVYMTAPTRRLAEIMLEDSAKIQQHRELNPAETGFLDYGAGTMEAAYRLADVTRVLDDEVVREVSPGLAVPIADTSFVVRFLPVAHVLGSCAIHLTDVDNDQTLLYTGDLGPIANPQATLPQYALSEMLAADLVVMESTYGSQPHEFTDGRVRRRQLSMRESDLKQLCERATRAAERGGCMLLPAFSLGRTQELAMLIEQARRDGEAPSGEIIVAGMGERITQVYEAYSKGTNAWARAQDMPRVDELGGRVRKTGKPFAEAAAEALDGDFSYIIASPAMLGSGWSRTFLEQMVENPAHAIVMSGFVPRHGGGIPGLHRMHTGATMELSGRSVRVQASFDQLKGLSAHAPAVDLRKFAAYMARQSHSAAFAMVHGEEAAQRALAEDVGALPEVALAESLHNSQVWQPRRP